MHFVLHTNTHTNTHTHRALKYEKGKKMFKASKKVDLDRQIQLCIVNCDIC